ncbi:MAG: cytochrome b/b6 domain-containing protein [Alphaproteobacteria bacterium]
MNIMQRIRTYHATLAILTILAYLTGELGLIHAWLGYGVAIVITLRLLWALSGERQVGLMRFYPSFEGLQTSNLFTHPAISKTLMLGIALSLLAVTGTGIAIDKGKSIGLADVQTVSAAYADDDEHEGGGEKEEGFLGESHELFANLLLLFVGMHVTYIVLFKFPLAKFMLFVPKDNIKK